MSVIRPVDVTGTSKRCVCLFFFFFCTLDVCDCTHACVPVNSSACEYLGVFDTACQKCVCASVFMLCFLSSLTERSEAILSVRQQAANCIPSLINQESWSKKITELENVFSQMPTKARQNTARLSEGAPSSPPKHTSSIDKQSI